MRVDGKCDGHTDRHTDTGTGKFIFYPCIALDRQKSSAYHARYNCMCQGKCNFRTDTIYNESANMIVRAHSSAVVWQWNGSAGRLQEEWNVSHVRWELSRLLMLLVLLMATTIWCSGALCIDKARRRKVSPVATMPTRYYPLSACSFYVTQPLRSHLYKLLRVSLF